MLWTPKNQNPRPVNSLPIYMDVNLTVGGTNTFDVPPGQVDQVLRVHPAGRRPAAGRRRAHARLRRRRAAGGRGDRQGDHARVATRDAQGKVIKVSRKLFGVSGDGLKLKADHKYRVVGDYDNPTGETRVKGAMAHMVGLFALRRRRRGSTRATPLHSLA